MLPGVVLPSNGLSSFGQFEKGTICSVCLKGNGYWHLFIGVTLYFLKNCKTFESPQEILNYYCYFNFLFKLKIFVLSTVCQWVLILS